MASSRGRLWRSLAIAGLVSLTAAAAAAAWLQHARRSVRRRRAKAAAAAGRVPSLAEEIQEALAREAAENLTELPNDELQSDFAYATVWVGSQGGSLSTDAKLQLYGCYKQVSTGDAPPERPRGIEASMKWEAWKEHIGTSRAEAMQKYVATLDRLAPAWRASKAGGASAAAPTDAKSKPDGSSSMGLAVSTMGRIGDPERADDVDETPVGQLCEKIADGDVEEARRLLRRQPDLAFQIDKDGMTPLHWAADRGELEVAKVLVQMASKKPKDAAAAYLNARDSTGETPLHYAVNTDNVELARLLMGAGADPNIENEDGEAPLGLAEGQDAWAGVLGA